MFNAMIETLKANPRKIVFTEGHDARILEATDRLVKGGFLTPILIGNVDVVKANAAKGGYNIEGVEIIDPETYPEMDAMVDKMVPQGAVQGQLLRHHAGEDGLRRLPAGRRDLLHC